MLRRTLAGGGLAVRRPAGKAAPMEWSDQGIVLSTRRHGEAALLVEAFTREHGLWRALVRGGASRRAGALEPGTEAAFRWRARLAEQLGAFQVEALRSRAAAVLDEPRALEGMTTALAMAAACLPEREAHPALYDGFLVLLQAIADDGPWQALLVRFELELLSVLGFGLDLGTCAVTGRNDHLTHVSPRTGRAVSAAAAEPYAERLLPLPDFLVRPGLAQVDGGDVVDGMVLTGHFLERHVLAPQQRSVPAVRVRLAARLAREAGRGHASGNLLSDRA
ncbi:DNA repair protein RecO [Zavarzinia sp. CC-PAN008]|uniref:DNA repair protein RecO n=1 Tax=Zavarzinia sp. CC-PAN008 TaxID=3243332 RepID=UPI003F742537